MTFPTALEPKFDPTEYGDFQTPLWLARQIVRLMGQDTAFKAVLEPTCGMGNFLWAAVEGLPSLERAVGLEINPEYVQFARERTWTGILPDIRRADVFETDLGAVTQSLPEPYLVLGNPPWITNAGQGTINGENLPRKSNLKNLSGLDALTGKSNFDVSEWILIHLLEQISSTQNACAMIVKSSVARKLILYARNQGMWLKEFRLHEIDAKKAFDVSVSACVLCFRGSPREADSDFNYRSFSSLDTTHFVLYQLEGDHFVSDPVAFASSQKYATSGQKLWRSGVKHDLARVMELRRLGEGFVNGDGAVVEVEPDLLYPLLKSSDVAKGLVTSRLYTLITQRRVGAPTDSIALEQPKTWAYLERYTSLFSGRKSSIYNGKPPFSIFGIGPYSFAPYKIAISGRYKRLQFTLLEPINGKCVMLDDTCYFLGFEDVLTARVYLAALERPEAHRYFEARIEWSDKRPIKKDILDSFDLTAFIKDHATVLQPQVCASNHSAAREVKLWFLQFSASRLEAQPLLLDTP